MAGFGSVGPVVVVKVHLVEVNVADEGASVLCEYSVFQRVNKQQVAVVSEDRDAHYVTG